jgi:hypothetical protein
MPPQCSKAKSLSEQDAIGKAGLQPDYREKKADKKDSLLSA